MKTINLFISGLLAFSVLGGCMATQAADPVPALVDSPSAETRQVLERAVAKMLGAQHIKLADSVFTEKSTVIIERTQHKDNQGRLLNGRESLGTVDTFSLLTENNLCYLRHNQSQAIVELPAIRCKAN